VRPYLSIFARGFIIVAMTATNVGQIAGRHWGGAFCVGFGISFVWWMNARSAARADLAGLRECYALGAASGTVFGMALVRYIYG
jgi:hypothetical protein